MSRKIKRRVLKKHKHKQLKFHHANMVYFYKYIEGESDFLRPVTAIYTSRPLAKGAWGIHYRHAPHVIDYRLVWDWYC